jgi:hypothetical protein
MALPTAYLTSAKNLETILNAIKTAQAPEKFTGKFLESLEFKSPSDRLIIGVLKSLGFLTDDAKPTQRYFNFLDQTLAAKVLAEGIRDAYKDIFAININAHSFSKEELVNKFKTLSQGQLSESVLDKMALTFTALVKQADFTASPQKQPEKTSALGEEAASGKGLEKSGEPIEGTRGKVKIEGLVYNIQLVLPESRDPKVYDALFKSLREHLA